MLPVITGNNLFLFYCCATEWHPNILFNLKSHGDFTRGNCWPEWTASAKVGSCKWGVHLALKGLHCHPRWLNRVTDDRTCGIFLTPDLVNLPQSTPTVDKEWPVTLVTTDHWDPFVFIVYHTRKVRPEVTRQTGELWLSGAGLGIWYLGTVCTDTDKIEPHGWMRDKADTTLMMNTSMKTDHTKNNLDYHHAVISWYPHLNQITSMIWYLESANTKHPL